MPLAAKINFLTKKLQLIMPPAAQINFFMYFASIYYASGGQNQFLNAEASTYYASGGQNSFFLVTFTMQNRRIAFFVAATALGPLHRVERQKEYAIRPKISFVGPLSVEL